MIFTPKDEAKLAALHPDLVRVVRRWARTTKLQCVVLETARSAAQQKINVSKGVSQTSHSRHVVANNKCHMACAIDLGVYKTIKPNVLSWEWPDYAHLASEMKIAANVESVPIEWGGDWHTIKDGPHFQLPWDKYP